MEKFPQYVLIQTTSYCNAQCLICPYGSTKDTQEQGVMAEELFRKIIDETAQYQDEVKQIMPYLMNEPLCDAQLVEKIYYIREKNPRAWIHLVTNGLLLDEMRGAALLESPLNSMKISMLAHRQDTLEHVMGNSDFGNLLEKINTFTMKAYELRGDSFVSVCFTNTPGYVEDDEIEEAYSYWKSRNIRYEVIPMPISRAGNILSIDAPLHKKVMGCRSIWRDTMVHILFNGDVVLCCMDWKRQCILGNIRKQSIYDVWNSARYNEVRQLIAGEKHSEDDFLCLHCEEAIAPE